MTIEGPYAYLPKDLFREIASFLPLGDAFRCGHVCKRWQALIAEDARWEGELTKRGITLVTGTSPKNQLTSHLRELCNRYLPLAAPLFSYPKKANGFDIVAHLEPRIPNVVKTLLRKSMWKDKLAEDAVVKFLQGGGSLQVFSSPFPECSPLIQIEELLLLPFDENFSRIFRSRGMKEDCPFQLMLSIMERTTMVKPMPQELWDRILAKLFDNQEILNNPSICHTSFAKIINYAPSISKTYLMRAVTKPCSAKIVIALINGLPPNEVSDELWDLILDYSHSNELNDDDTEEYPMTSLYNKCQRAGRPPDAALFKRVLDQTMERSAALPRIFSVSEKYYYEKAQFDHPRGRPVFYASQDHLVEFLFSKLQGPLPQGTLMKCLSCGFQERFIKQVIARVEQVSLAEWRKALSMGYSKEVLAQLTLKSLKSFF